MRQLQLTSAALVPHAPLLLEGVGPADPERAALREAAAALDLDGDATILLSAHGTRAGVYATSHGSLDARGIRGMRVEAEPAPALARDLASAWDVGLLDEPLDHGATVALLLTKINGPVVIACLSEITNKDGAQGPQAIDEGRRFATALRALDGPRASFVASAHTGAALAERGPLGKRWSALELEEQVRRAIEDDPARLGSLAFDLWLESGSCGSGVLAALAVLVGGPGQIKAYGAPHGVGYVVAGFPT